MSAATFLRALLGVLAVAATGSSRRRWKRQDERAFRASDVRFEREGDMEAFMARAMRTTREELAALSHEQWCGWMDYMFSKGALSPDGTFTLPAELVDRWQRQRQTPYAELPEEEKGSDRIEADKVIAVWCDVPFDFT